MARRVIPRLALGVLLVLALVGGCCIVSVVGAEYGSEFCVITSDSPRSDRYEPGTLVFNEPSAICDDTEYRVCGKFEAGGSSPEPSSFQPLEC